VRLDIDTYPIICNANVHIDQLLKIGLVEGPCYIATDRSTTHISHKSEKILPFNGIEAAIQTVMKQS
jgi:hypothetical protein